jgi:nicotinate-nucleotide pyrophosphorylase
MDSDAEFTVIEVRDSSQAVAAVKAWDSLQIERSGCEKIVLLLDNMGPSGCAEVHHILMQENLRAWCILEGSGGVVHEDLGQWIESGVDLVSTSALNRGVSPLDLSMKVVGGD